MPLLTTYTAANLIIYENSPHNEKQTILGTLYTRTVLTVKKAYVGMDYDTAVLCLATVDTPETGSYASLKRSGDSGAYSVEVTEVTEGAWA